MKEFFDKVKDYFVNKMPGEMYVSLLIMIFIAVFAIVLGHKIKKADPTKPPKGLALVADYLVEFSQNSINNTLGTAYEKFSPYFIFLILFIPLAFISGLFGLPSPINLLTIPLCLALVTWLGIQISSIKYNKWGYLKSFADPLPPWLPIMAPINVLGKIAPLLSLSLRMFGNGMAGFLIMTMVYWATGNLSSTLLNLLIPNASWFNFIGLMITPFLHLYFDLVSAFIQTVIFVLLTMLLISIEIPAPVAKVDRKVIKEEKMKRKQEKLDKQRRKQIC